MVMAASPTGIGAGAMAAQANASADPAAYAFHGRDGICCRALSISLNRQQESGNPPGRFMALAKRCTWSKRHPWQLLGSAFSSTCVDDLSMKIRYPSRCLLKPDHLVFFRREAANASKPIPNNANVSGSGMATRKLPTRALA